MISKSSSFVALAALATAAMGIATGASAEDVVVQPRAEMRDMEDIPYVEVRYDDLNLANQTGRDRLTVRIDSAVRTVCGNADLRNLPAFMGMQQCRSDSTDRAYADRDMLFARIAEAQGRGETLAMAGGDGPSGTLAVAARRMK